VVAHWVCVDYPSRMICKKPFFYIRHGQTDWNLENRYQGQRDIPLNQTGIAQAHAAIDGLRNRGITHIYSSPLQRARRTADIINAVLKLPVVEVDDLQEVNFGALEGTLRTGDKFSEKWQAGTTPLQAETYVEFSARIFSAVNHVLAQDGTPLIVAHGAVFWPIHETTGIPLVGTLPNAVAIHVYPSSTADSGWVYD